jgi:hypothetical protein
MDNLKRATVSVLIDGDDLVPAEITTLLGANPRLGVRKDEVFLGAMASISRLNRQMAIRR